MHVVGVMEIHRMKQDPARLTGDRTEFVRDAEIDRIKYSSALAVLPACFTLMVDHQGRAWVVKTDMKSVEDKHWFRECCDDFIDATCV